SPSRYLWRTPPQEALRPTQHPRPAFGLRPSLIPPPRRCLLALVAIGEGLPRPVVVATDRRTSMPAEEPWRDRSGDPPSPMVECRGPGITPEPSSCASVSVDLPQPPKKEPL